MPPFFRARACATPNRCRARVPMMLRVRPAAVDDEGSFLVLVQIPCVEDELSARQAPPRGDAEALELRLRSRVEHARRRIAVDQLVQPSGRNFRNLVFHMNPLAKILARQVGARDRRKALGLPRAQPALQHPRVRVAALLEERGDAPGPGAALIHANHRRRLHGHEPRRQKFDGSARRVRRPENLLFMKLHGVADVEDRMGAIASHQFLQIGRRYPFRHPRASPGWASSGTWCEGMPAMRRNTSMMAAVSASPSPPISAACSTC